MSNLDLAPIKSYLERKGIECKESNGELLARCFFNDCDTDSRENEAHLYISPKTGQYHCKKCGESGNMTKIAKHFGDVPKGIDYGIRQVGSRGSRAFSLKLVERCHSALPDYIRKYLHDRCISDEIINQYKIGWGRFYGTDWITIPIKSPSGNFIYFKLRQDPHCGNKKRTYPKGVEAQIYDWQTLKNPGEKLIICEGELDRLVLLTKGLPAVTSTHGATTFKDSWVESFKGIPRILICLDNDGTGVREAKKVASKLKAAYPEMKTFLITLPIEPGVKDVTEYFQKHGTDGHELFEEYAQEYPKPIDISKFRELNRSDLSAILGITIKKDDYNKVVTFLCQLTAYSEDSQFNISYNAPSTTGKSYIPTEISKLFPEEDVLALGYCSPTAFFHEQSEYDELTNTYTIDFSHKILIFQDQPHNDLLGKLRPLLSHDGKEMLIKITDKDQKFGHRTKNVILKGYPSVIFCSAGFKINEQEATRCILLSPEISQEKIEQSIRVAIEKESDPLNYDMDIESDGQRQLLRERILAIKRAGIKEIRIDSALRGIIRERFCGDRETLKPRHQRDIKRVISLIKAFALLNLWWRKRTGSCIWASMDDVKSAFDIWDTISKSQEFNIPPFILDLFNDILKPLWEEKKSNPGGGYLKATDAEGITRAEVCKKHLEVCGRLLPATFLRQELLPALEAAGLIRQEADPENRRRMLIFLTDPTEDNDDEYSELKGGVNNNEGSTEDEE